MAMTAALESARAAVLGPSGPKFAGHVVFYGAAFPEYRDTATDRAPMLFLHGEADNYVPMGRTKEFADWARTQGSDVTFQSYPGVYHDFDVEGGVDRYVRGVETARNCDAVIDISTGQVVRMDGKAVSGVSGADFMRYIRGCLQRGADLHPNAAARADAVERAHSFLTQVFHMTG